MCIWPSRCRDPNFCSQELHAASVQDIVVPSTGVSVRVPYITQAPFVPLLFPGLGRPVLSYMYLTSWEERCLLLAPGLSHTEKRKQSCRPLRVVVENKLSLLMWLSPTSVAIKEPALSQFWCGGTKEGCA